MPISPNQGTTSGGTTITITGVNLANTLRVNFGENIATITANTPTSVTVISPAGYGVASVSVTTTGGTSNALSYFYIPPPIMQSMSPTSGSISGGNTVTITGYNLLTASSVNFGVNSVTPTIISDGTITVTAPEGSAGSVSVNVITAGGVSAVIHYSYVDAPTGDSLTPSSGSTTGGTVVTITGTGFQSTTNVTFGGVTASFGVINSTTISTITPTNSAGAVDVVITTSAGSVTLTSAFTYVNDPGI